MGMLMAIVGWVVIAFGVFMLLGALGNVKTEPKKTVAGMFIFGVVLIALGFAIKPSHNDKTAEPKKETSSVSKKVSSSASSSATVVPESKKNQTNSDVVIDENKLNSLAEKLQNGNTGDFIDEYTAMTMPEQSKYYRALVDKNVTATIKGSAFDIDSQGNKMMVYAGNDVPGTNITQPINAEDYFQDKQKEHQIFRVETEGSQFLTVDPMDDVTVTGKLDAIANLYQQDKMDGYFKLVEATLTSN